MKVVRIEADHDDTGMLIMAYFERLQDREFNGSVKITVEAGAFEISEYPTRGQA